MELSNYKAIKIVRYRSLGLFKSGAPHTLLKAPYANRYMQKKTKTTSAIKIIKKQKSSALGKFEQS